MRFKWYLILLSLCVVNLSNAQDGEKGIGVEAVHQAIDELPSSMRVLNRYAIIIGASEYDDDRIPDLPACGNDARGLYDVLTNPIAGMFAPDNVTLLVDSAVTEDAVIDAIDQLGRRVDSEDLVIVFFSGHGAIDSRGRSYWVMQDTVIDKLRATALAENEITDLLGDIQTSRLVTMIDACYSASTAKLGENKSVLDLKNIFPEFDGKGRVAMTASAGDQLSVVIPEGQPGHGYSAFAYHLIQGLGGKADGASGGQQEGVITVDELWGYVRDRTEATARRAGGNQKPQLKGAFGSRFMLTVDGRGLVESNKQIKGKLKALKHFLLDDKIGAEQYTQAKSLIILSVSQLNEFDAKRQQAYIDLINGKLDPAYLKGVLNNITSEETQAMTPAESPTTDEPEVIVEQRPTRTPKFDNRFDSSPAQQRYEDPFAIAMQELIQIVQASSQVHPAAQAWGYSGKDQIVSFLSRHTSLNRQAFADSTSMTGGTPLHYAAEYNAPNAVQMLIQSGADVDEEDSNDLTPLHFAAKVNAADALMLLIRAGGDVDEEDSKDMTPLFYAAIGNAPDAVVMLVQAGADHDQEDDYEKRPVHHAAANNSADAIAALRSVGADINIRDDDGLAPLHHAALNNASDAIYALYQAGADIDVKIKNGFNPFNSGGQVKSSSTPLHIAVNQNGMESVRVLINAKANPNAKDKDGDTPLHIAARENNGKMVTYLISKGAQYTQKGKGGRTPLSRALKNNCPDAVAALKAAGARE